MSELMVLIIVLFALKIEKPYISAHHHHKYKVIHCHLVLNWALCVIILVKTCCFVVVHSCLFCSLMAERNLELSDLTGCLIRWDARYALPASEHH